MPKPYRTDTDYDMSIEYPEKNITGIYTAVSYHRNGTANKSQWTISVDEEIDLFADTKQKGQIYEDKGHALWVIDAKAEVLGLTEKGNETRLARFEDGNRIDHWHGYPANYLKAKNDIPPMELLLKWRNQNLITKADITRLKQQKPCSLQRLP